eukprot:9363047-Prorocentrum_lima.AAC.1
MMIVSLSATYVTSSAPLSSTSESDSCSCSRGKMPSFSRAEVPAQRFAASDVSSSTKGRRVCGTTSGSGAGPSYDPAYGYGWSSSTLGSCTGANVLVAGSSSVGGGLVTMPV